MAGVAIALILASNIAASARAAPRFPPVAPRLILGEDVDADAVPLWHAYLEVVTPDKTVRCGGGLVAPTRVVTAAHCVVHAPAATVVRVFTNGVRDFANRQSRWPSSRHYRVVPIDRWWVHPDYDPGTWGDDVAVGYLDTPVRLAHYPRPVLDEESWTQAVGERLPLKVHGFGWEEDGQTPGVMERVTIRGTPPGSCRAAWGALVHDNDLCAIGACEQTEDHGLLCRDSCRGDSGGLLVHMPNGPNGADVRVYGVVSRGSRDCGRHATHPGIYTSFAQHSAFVGAALEAGGPGDPGAVPDQPGADEENAATPRARTLWYYIIST